MMAAERSPASMRPTRTPYRSILIIKPGAIGDLLQMSPVMRALRTAYPGAKITLVVGSASTAALFRHNPNIDATQVFDRRGEHKTLSARLALWKSLRRRRADLVLNFQRSNLPTWFLVTAALPCRILVYRKARGRSVHAVVNYLETLAPLGISPGDPRLELFLDEPSRVRARELLDALPSGPPPIIALNPGASHAVNRWPPGHFAELADLLGESGAARTVIVGGPGDERLADEVRERSRSRPPSFAGRTSLLELGALLERCAALVSGDTGPLHMATAVGAPVVALFGAADPLRTGPVGSGHRILTAPGISCAPCRSRACSNARYLECMERLTPQSVFHAVREILRQGPRSASR